MSGTTINTSIRIVLSCFLLRQLKFSIFWRFSCDLLWFFVPFADRTHSEYATLVTTSQAGSNKYSSLYRVHTDPFKSNTLCNRLNSLCPQPSRQTPRHPLPPPTQMHYHSFAARCVLASYVSVPIYFVTVDIVFRWSDLLSSDLLQWTSTAALKNRLFVDTCSSRRNQPPQSILRAIISKWCKNVHIRLEVLLNINVPY